MSGPSLHLSLSWTLLYTATADNKGSGYFLKWPLSALLRSPDPEVDGQPLKVCMMMMIFNKAFYLTPTQFQPFFSPFFCWNGMVWYGP